MAEIYARITDESSAELADGNWLIQCGVSFANGLSEPLRSTVSVTFPRDANPSQINQAHVDAVRATAADLGHTIPANGVLYPQVARG